VAKGTLNDEGHFILLLIQGHRLLVLNSSLYCQVTDDFEKPGGKWAVWIIVFPLLISADEGIMYYNPVPELDRE
jgi:hypothetical protein